MEMPQYKKIKSMLKAIQNSIASVVAQESTSQEILAAAQGAKTAAENANTAASEVGGFRKPIRVVTGEAGNSDSKRISGYGKGKLFVNTEQANYSWCRITIDGTAIFDGDFTDVCFNNFEIEFTESFTVQGENDSYGVHVVAVFYE